MPLTRTDRIELLDHAAETATPAELAGNLRDIRRANRYFGGVRAVLAELTPILREQQGSAATLSVLDVATGSADIPLAISEFAARSGVNVRITATDAQPEVVAVARDATEGTGIHVEQADARCLPYPPGSFDVVLLSLALHHFDPREATEVLREMRRVGRRALIVNDLERSRAGLAGAWLYSRALTTNRLTRHDAPLSVRRAYTAGEALALATAAHWPAARVRKIVPFRFVLTGEP